MYQKENHLISFVLNTFHTLDLNLNFIRSIEIYNMNIKRFFGGLLTILGIVALIYTAVLFANLSNGTHAIRAVIIYGVLGLVFFISGISLIRTIRDN